MLARFARRIAPRLARAVFVVATVVLLFGIGLAALGVAVASWPYRRVYGPTRRRTQVEAALQLAQAAAAFAAVLRHGSERDAGGIPRE